MEHTTEIDLIPWQTEAPAYDTIDALNVAKARDYIVKLKSVSQEINKLREEEVRPHIDEQKRINKLRLGQIDVLESIWKAISLRVAQHEEAERVRVEQAQAALIAESAKARQESEELATMARDMAATERLKGNDALSEVYDAEAQALEVRAGTDAPTILPQVPKTTKLDNGKSLRIDVEPDWTLPFPNYDKQKTKVPADYSLMKGVPLSFFVLDPVAVNRYFKAHKTLPKPFVLTKKVRNVLR